MALFDKKPVPPMIRLVDATFCVDCETISDSTNNYCVACGCRSLVSVARLLGGALVKPDNT
jgi:hypothetical protein